MQSNDLDFRLARPEDLSAVEQMYQRVVAQLNENNIPQWDDIYPSKTIFQEDISHAQLHLGFMGGTLCSAYVLSREYDAEYANGCWSCPDAAYLVLHRLAVEPAFQNQGIGKRTMLHIESLARGEGAGALRLDAFARNPYALKLYQTLGYSIVGEAHWRKGKFFLFEKKIL